ncbi:L-threonylcarbamoyladenylate synthase [Natronospira bacteriovora]|uniref:L-threonylcarbamoyladenylate synthase n=1 Tax=Natronospira bacteriovora TaxID=3069753 RepID=A0ABU0W559_9GAMM|nr:L-threonylcarbamoyladenylate synthase [Natronospira sp. AB-CW4]MDQ2069161.1 L-threonylcarbamoyladenylate synthase [Natronospira sp. AB-CW4]
MSQYFQIHPVDPQPRLIRQAVRILRDGGVIAYPTDSIYALGCMLDAKPAVERIQWLRQVDKDHNLTLVCRDLSEIGNYARVDNVVFRLLKAHTPGPYTFILKATGEVPRRLQNPKRKTIGIRVPDNAIVRALLEEHGEPILSSTLLLPGDEIPLSDPEDIRDRLEHHVDLVIDGGNCGLEPSTVVDLSDGPPRVLRQGRGDPGVFQP